MPADLLLYIDVTSQRLVRPHLDEPVREIILTQHERLSVELHFLEPSGDSRAPFRSVDSSGYIPKLGIAYFSAAGQRTFVAFSETFGTAGTGTPEDPWRRTGELSLTTQEAIDALGALASRKMTLEVQWQPTEGSPQQLKATVPVLVRNSYIDTVTSNLPTQIVTGPAGRDGQSAYEIATAAGFVGNQLEWIASLHGADGRDGAEAKDGVPGRDGIDGKDGRDGIDGTGIPGHDGTNGREIELHTSSSHVQWRYTGDTVWIDLVSLSALTGAAGSDGIDGRNGIDGVGGRSAYALAVDSGYSGTIEQWLESLHGAAGKNGTSGLSAYQLAVDSGYPGTLEQWLDSLRGPSGKDGRDAQSAYAIALSNGFVGSEVEWLTFLCGADGRDGIDGKDGVGVPGRDGINGRQIELRTNDTHIQWCHAGDADWIDLVSLSALTGAAGRDGTAGRDGLDGVGTSGTDGADGREIELGKSATHVQWRYVGGAAWTNLVALADISGPAGTDGGGGGSSAVVALLPEGGIVQIPGGGRYDLALTADVALEVTAPITSSTVVVVRQDAVGSRKIAFPAGWFWESALPPVLSVAPDAIDLLQVETGVSGMPIFASLRKSFAAISVDSPTAVVGLVGWYKPQAVAAEIATDNANTVVGGVISRLWDFSGNGNHLEGTAAVAAAWSVGKNAIKLNGVSDSFLTAGPMTLGTVLVAYQCAPPINAYAGLITSRGTDRFVFCRNATDASWYSRGADGVGGCALEHAYVRNVPSNAEPVGTAAIIGARGTVETWPQLQIGADRAMAGRNLGSVLGEIVVYDNDIGVANYGKVAAYLAAAWGLA